MSAAHGLFTVDGLAPAQTTLYRHRAPTAVSQATTFCDAINPGHGQARGRVPPPRPPVRSDPSRRDERRRHPSPAAIPVRLPLICRAATHGRTPPPIGLPHPSVLPSPSIRPHPQPAAPLLMLFPFRLRVRGLHSYTRLSWIPHKQVSRTEEQNPASYESGKSRTMYTKID
ncbi:hypothetical protein B296_00009409 [Ensete ventricosum]|uniref:Uncharacterized protein n=1 Tax=Ensete ventricosum TaxID=4639 RepID=A0A427B6R4_ENSVE|nr:hypothetical protein B296_00009409 [Ensete ventricosum]